MPTTIKYKGSTIAELGAGEIGTISCNDKEMEEDIIVIAPEAEESAVPIEVSTEAEMTALLETGEVGGVYKYVGETGTYENGAMYVLEEEPDPLVGTWVFNDTVTEPEQGAGIGAFVTPLDTYTVIGSFDGQTLDCNTLSPTAMVGMVYDYGTFYLGLDGELASYTASQLAGKTLVLNEKISNEGIEINDRYRSWLPANATKQ